ncbi:hypothetical protein AB9D59_11620 [Blautia producta]|uniref:hypothetical protein n=1 Tax=Blautia producta TaxID=33035 RepID=UPI0004980464
MERYCRIRCEKDDFSYENNSEHEISFVKIMEDIFRKNNFFKEEKCPKRTEEEIENEIYMREAEAIKYGHPKVKSSEQMHDDEKELLFLKEYNVKERFQSVFTCYACELDILNDIYLAMVQASGSLVNLLNGWKTTHERAKTIIQKVKNDQKKKVASKNTAYIFSYDFESVRVETKIPELGCGLTRFWFISGTFRKLFDKVKYTVKYSWENIIDILNEMNQMDILYNQDDLIICEKLLGVNTIAFFRKYIYERCPELSDKSIENIIRTILKCKGSFSRCYLLMILGSVLDENIHLNINEIEIKVSIWMELLNDCVISFEKYYDTLLKTIMEELKTNYIYDTVLAAIKDRRTGLLCISLKGYTEEVVQMGGMEEEIKAFQEEQEDDEEQEKVDSFHRTNIIYQNRALRAFFCDTQDRIWIPSNKSKVREEGGGGSIEAYPFLHQGVHIKEISDWFCIEGETSDYEEKRLGELVNKQVILENYSYFNSNKSEYKYRDGR